MAAQRDRWQPAAAIMALTANCHRDAKQRKQPFTPEDFMPVEPSKKPKVTVIPGTIQDLKVFLGMR